jgi:hypothetical protein
MGGRVMSDVSIRKNYKKKKKEKEYILRKDIVIQAGTKIFEGPTSVAFVSKHYECLLGFGKDHTGSLYVDEDLVKEFPDFFLEIRKA